MLARRGGRQGSRWRVGQRECEVPAFRRDGEMEDLQLRGVQRQSNDSHLVLPHIPHHLLPHRLFLDLIICLLHLLHILLAQVALVFLLGYPCWLPASSWYQQMGWMGGELSLGDVRVVPGAPLISKEEYLGALSSSPPLTP